MGLKEKVAETALELVKSENVQNKTVELFGMLFPYAGIKKKAIDLYIEEIENSDLSTDAKMIALLNARGTLKKLKNQKNIAEIAKESAEEGTDFKETSGVNEEWLDRFMESAGFVSSEDMQVIWGKILANEFEKPGTTPPNMIRVLSEITPTLARAFRKICSMKIWICPLSEDRNIEQMFQKIFVPYSEHSAEFYQMGLSFNILNELETLGVIKFSSISGYVSKGIDNNKVLLCIGDKLELIDSHKKDEVPIGNVLLTSVGQALQKITEVEEIPNYYEMIREYVLNNGIKFADEHEYQLTAVGDAVGISRKI